MEYQVKPKVAADKLEELAADKLEELVADKLEEGKKLRGLAADKVEEGKKLKGAEKALRVTKMGYLKGRLGKATGHRLQTSIGKKDHSWILCFWVCFCFCFCFWVCFSFLHLSTLFFHVDSAFVQHLLLQVLVERSAAELKVLLSLQ